MYGKFLNGSIEYAPYHIRKESKDILNYNLDSNAEMLIADGYKPVIDNPAPSEMKKPRKVWKESDTELIATWVDDYVEPTIEEQNEAIRQTRESLYFQTSDRIKADYDEALTRGASNAEQLKKEWLASKDKIRAENPYIDNKEKKVIMNC